VSKGLSKTGDKPLNLATVRIPQKKEK